MLLIIGDVMLDKNYLATVSKIANEAPIPVYNIYSKKYLLGGAGNLAINISNIISNGKQTHLVYVANDDNSNHHIKHLLTEKSIDFKCFTDPDRSTTTKRRIFVDNKLVSRCDIETNLKISNQLADQIIEHIADINPDYIIISDYNKGVITDYLLDSIRNKYKIMVDPKGNNPDRFRDFYLIKPNLNEFNMLNNTSLSHKDIECAIKTYSHKYNNENIIVTLSQYGICGYNKTSDTFLYFATHVENVIDVTGAGDTCLAVISYCMVNDFPLADTLKMCNYFGECAVKTVGNYSLTREAITSYYLGFIDKVLPDIETLENLVKNIRSLNKTIVFTNGCFDILHLGHLQYLKRAKELGNYLIVGINSDSSIKRNKGDSRPYNTVDTRVKMLQELSCVDYIIIFTEDTPLRLIRIICPDVLVKGGDYKVRDIVGREYAKTTCITNYLDGFSSTKFIQVGKTQVSPNLFL